MLRRILLTSGFMLLFTSVAFAKDYIYLENPDPQNFEIFFDTSDHPDKIVKDSNGDVTRVCWINKSPESAIIRDKISKIPICTLYATYTTYHYIIGERKYNELQSSSNGECSVILGDSGNTWWVSAAFKADGNSAQAYKTWDCG